MTILMTLLRAGPIVGGLFVCLQSYGFCDSPKSPSPTPSAQENLSEYAKGRKLRRQSGGATTGVEINDDNIKELAAESELTSVTQTPTPRKDSTINTGLDDPRELWRSRIQTQLQKVGQLEDEIENVESEIRGLWEMFYACDDPVEREDRIRPDLVHKIEDRVTLFERIDSARVEMEKLLEDARKSGALPGWYRDLLR